MAWLVSASAAGKRARLELAYDDSNGTVTAVRVTNDSHSAWWVQARHRQSGAVAVDVVVEPGVRLSRTTSELGTVAREAEQQDPALTRAAELESYGPHVATRWPADGHSATEQEPAPDGREESVYPFSPQHRVGHRE